MHSKYVHTFDYGGLVYAIDTSSLAKSLFFCCHSWISHFPPTFLAHLGQCSSLQVLLPPWRWHFPLDTAKLIHPSIQHLDLFFPAWRAHFPPDWAMLLHSSSLQVLRLRLRLPPWRQHFPPDTTKLIHPSIQHLFPAWRAHFPPDRTMLLHSSSLQVLRLRLPPWRPHFPPDWVKVSSPSSKSSPARERRRLRCALHSAFRFPSHVWRSCN